MIYEFKCRATGTVVMTKTVGETMLDIIGKSPAEKGVITPEQMTAAIAALEQAVSVAKAREARPAAAAGEDRSDGEDDTRLPSLAQRAYPFIEMLRAAHKAGKEITWGV